MGRRKSFYTLSVVFVIFSSLFSICALAGIDLPSISKDNYISTYTYSSSGRVYAYTDSSLTKKTGGYISCSSDENRIISIDGDAVQVSYPVSNGRKTAWFHRDKFTYRDLAKDGAKLGFKSSKQITTYKWKKHDDKYGYISENDYCYLLRGDQDSEWLQVLYPVKTGYKMAWVKGNDAVSTIWSEASSSDKPTNYLLYINGFSNDSASYNTYSQLETILNTNMLFNANKVILNPIVYDCESTGISPQDFELELNNRLSSTTAKDVVFIYLAAHGNTDIIGLGDRIYHYSNLLNLLANTNCGKFVLLLEPCRSGTIVNWIEQLNDTDKKRFVVLTSSDTQTYGQYLKENYFLFGKALTGGLSKSGTYCNADWNNDQNITVKELADYVSVYMKNKLLERKQVLWFDFSAGWDDQIPVYYAISDDVVIFKY